MTQGTQQVNDAGDREPVPGDVLVVTSEAGDYNFFGHGFEKGQHVRLVAYEEDSFPKWRAEHLDGHDYWWLHRTEFTVVNDAGGAK